MVGDRFISTLQVFLGFQIAQAGMVEVLAIVSPASDGLQWQIAHSHCGKPRSFTMEVTDYVGGYKLCVRVLLESFPFSYLASRY
jgi:hypothetical protein